MQTREALNDLVNVEIVGELAAFEDRHARFLTVLAPEIVILDLAATGLNPVRVMNSVRDLPGQPRVIAVAQGGGMNKRIAQELGATAVVETSEALKQAVRRESLRLVPTHDYDRAA